MHMSLPSLYLGNLGNESPTTLVPRFIFASVFSPKAHEALIWGVLHFEIVLDAA